jgi:hypothetical protein
MSRQPSFKIVLPDDLRAKLEAAAEREGLSLAELMRRKLIEATAPESYEVRRLKSYVGGLAELVEHSTGHRFDTHPAAAETLRQAISVLLERMGARTDAKFTEADLVNGTRFVPGTDPATMGPGLEALLAGSLWSSYEIDELGELGDGKTLKLLGKLPSDGAGSNEHERREKRPRQRLSKEGVYNLSRQFLTNMEKSLTAEITRFEGMLRTAGADQKDMIAGAIQGMEQQLETIRRLREK